MSDREWRSNADTICDSLANNPAEWKANSCRLWHESGVQFWVGKGWVCLGPHCSDTAVLLSWWGKWKVWKAYKHWKKRQLALFLLTKGEV